MSRIVALKATLVVGLMWRAMLNPNWGMVNYVLGQLGLPQPLWLADPSLAPGQIDGAITAMLTFHRPIYLEVAQNVWTQECGEPEGELCPIPLLSNAQYVSQMVAAAWGSIVSAENPVLWFGVEIQRYGLQDLAQKLVDVSGLPFTTTRFRYESDQLVSASGRIFTKTRAAEEEVMYTSHAGGSPEVVQLALTPQGGLKTYTGFAPKIWLFGCPASQ